MKRGRGQPRKKVPTPSDHRIREAREDRADSPLQMEMLRDLGIASDGSKVAMEDSVDEDLSPIAMDTNPPAVQATIGGESTEPNRVEAHSPEKLWVDVISGNRMSANGIAIEFAAPQIVNGEPEVTIVDDDVDSEVNFWTPSLIMYVLGGELSMNAVKQYMVKFWDFVHLPAMYYNEEGYFILRFRSVEDRDAVMMKGPYTIHNMSMFLCEWKPDFCLHRDVLRILSIWVKFPQLPLHLWGAKSLGKIGSALGKPLFTDECTANKLRISYARILVEVDITQKMKEYVTIKDNKGRLLKQPVEFEWKPLFCDSCQRVGHQCRKRASAQKKWHKPGKQKEWQVRAKQPVRTTEANHSSSDPPHVVTTPVASSGVPAVDRNMLWTTVVTTRRDKGKDIMGAMNTGPSSPDVRCHNGFAPLRILSDPVVQNDKVP